ncbi:MAG: hypothetical protein AB2L07_09095 [Thermoanaerobaculaceae bacterium]
MNEEPEKLELASMDVAEERRRELQRVFPEVGTEGGTTVRWLPSPTRRSC